MTRLIDADKLYPDCLTKNGRLAISQNQIANAPTVEVRDNFDIGYVQGLEDGQKRPRGEWIIVKDERYGDNVKCPFCGKELAGTDLNFCCKCGAYMREADNE